MASKKTFDFKLGDRVKLAMSEERGSIIGRAHYLEADPQYDVRYVAADGRMVEGWLSETAIVADASPSAEQPAGDDSAG